MNSTQIAYSIGKNKNRISEYNFMFITINQNIFKLLKSHSYNKWVSVSKTSMVYFRFFQRIFVYVFLLTLILVYWAIIQALAVDMFENS